MFFQPIISIKIRLSSPKSHFASEFSVSQNVSSFLSLMATLFGLLLTNGTSAPQKYFCPLRKSFLVTICCLHHGVHFCGFFVHLCSRPRCFPHLFFYISRERKIHLLLQLTAIRPLSWPVFVSAFTIHP